REDGRQQNVAAGFDRNLFSTHTLQRKRLDHSAAEEEFSAIASAPRVEVSNKLENRRLIRLGFAPWRAPVPGNMAAVFHHNGEHVPGGEGVGNALEHVIGRLSAIDGNRGSVLVAHEVAGVLVIK